ncbi:MAG: hypothetical protein FWH22_10105, partial [Fibromonadales bacterium]|nr:hypothetical protein [Fibromonadales bacterium]
MRVINQISSEGTNLSAQGRYAQNNSQLFTLNSQLSQEISYVVNHPPPFPPPLFLPPSSQHPSL